MPQTIAIIGLGLIGGSLAKAVKLHTPHRVHGIDHDADTLAATLGSGAVDDAGTSAHAERLLADADIVIVALSPDATVEWVERYVGAIRENAVVTDVCGVKRHIIQHLAPLCSAHDLRYVPGHPMAGRERGGFANSDAELFKNCSYIFTPDEHTDSDALETLRTLVTDLGAARVTITTAEHHDRMIAFTSQLPHVLAGAYVKSDTSAGHVGYSAGSYRDVSRVAAVDETLWSRLLQLNRDNLTTEIDTLITHLTQYRNALTTDDANTIASVIRDGRERKLEIDGVT
ncbi:MAG: prephenate dehydrogenase/arogenate dehydrogenase family protein [Oscillospiraceae bacterium]|jgi:prephenate dehydrogenase|nr:prephenate dehydrogenase/arogenate dehydrogenase family protein [Oscillospiraceae bacterium]